VIVRDLQVMFLGNRARISNPGAHDMKQPLFGQLRLSGGAHVVPGLWPRLEASTLGKPDQMGAKVAILLPVSRDNKLDTIFGSLVRFKQGRTQRRKERNHPGCLAFVLLGFGSGDQDALVIPIHIRPAQWQNFRGDAQPKQNCTLFISPPRRYASTIE